MFQLSEYSFINEILYVTEDVQFLGEIYRVYNN